VSVADSTKMGSAMVTVMASAAATGSSSSSTGGGSSGSTSSSSGSGGGSVEPLTLLVCALVVGLVAKRRQAGCEDRPV
jgi:hypothetical protein